MKRTLALFGLVLFINQLLAQNVVVNGGFEDYNYVPTSYTQWAACKNWTNAGGGGTPDYYSILSNGGVHLPNTSAGTYIYPHSGNATMGFLTWSGSLGINYREYFTNQLSQPLTPGTQYNVTFYLSNGKTPYYGYGSNNIGLYFSDAAPTQPGSDVIPVNPQVEIKTIFFDTGWVKFTFTFTPTTANQFLTIGNFRNDAATSEQNFYPHENRAYYYIDDIDIEPVQGSSKPLAAFIPHDTAICPGGSITFINQSKNATRYSWSFPGGNPTVSNDTNPVVSYIQPGEYDVQLIVSNGSSFDTLLIHDNVTVKSLPYAGIIIATRDTICEGTGITSTLKTDSSTGLLQWQSSVAGAVFGDITSANSSSYTTPPQLSQTTSYRLTASNSCSTDSSNVAIVHIVPSLVAVFNYTIDNKQVSFNSSGTSSGIKTYTWDFGDGTVSSDSNPIHNYNEADTFNVCLTVYNGSFCSYTICKSVDVLNVGVLTISADNFIRLYPNPASNTINLKVEGLEGNYQLTVYNVLGQEVLHEQLNLGQQQAIPIDLKDFTPDTYELVLIGDKEYYSKQFVHLK